jgi:transcriptional regulator with XRE-family HTH domain
MRIDWHAVFEDFAHLGLTGDELAERIGIATSLLQRVATGRVQPGSLARDRIVGLWAHLTGKPAAFVPRTSDPIGAPRPDVYGIDSNEQREQSAAQLQAITMAWAQINAGG